MLGLALLLVAAIASARHLASAAREILPSLPTMNDVTALVIAARANLQLLASLLADVAPLAAVKSERAFAFVEKRFQHVGTRAPREFAAATVPQ